MLLKTPQPLTDMPDLIVSEAAPLVAAPTTDLRPLDQSPAAVYLAQLAPSGRRTMQQAWSTREPRCERARRSLTIEIRLVLPRQHAVRLVHGSVLHLKQREHRERRR